MDEGARRNSGKRELYSPGRPEYGSVCCAIADLAARKEPGALTERKGQGWALLSRLYFSFLDR
ncbi:MAG: hypothetical protein CBD18_03975 [Opitutales bacterium TMED158]|nr:MAG: hypothetical protein CBD18_03975 [Opitutales bacterium TMED158]